MQYPMYIWLSVFGFMAQFLFSITKIIQRTPFQFNLCLKLITQWMLLIFGVMMAPVIILAFLIAVAEEISVILYYIVDGITLIYLYFGGVIAARSLYRWDKRYLSEENTDSP